MKTVACWGADCPNTVCVITVDGMLMCSLCHAAHGPQDGDHFVHPIRIAGTVTGIKVEVESDGRAQQS
jgi:hypothetical protein